MLRGKANNELDWVAIQCLMSLSALNHLGCHSCAALLARFRAHFFSKQRRILQIVNLEFPSSGVTNNL